MRYVVLAFAALLIAAAVAFAQPAQDPVEPPPPAATPTVTVTETPTPTATASPASGRPPDFAEITFRHSRSLGLPYLHGRLIDGVQLPELGEDFFTWDPVYNRIPNRGARRWGTDRLIREALTVIHDYRTVHDSAQRVGIMDISRVHGGPFGANYGGLGHASHQNGRDMDILYPRKDGLEARATKPSEVDQTAAQQLIDGFLKAGVQKIFVGPHLHHLHGPKDVVIPLVYHDDHFHVRIR